MRLRHFILPFFAYLSLGKAQNIDDVRFPSTNFTYCHQGRFNVSGVTRYFDIRDSSYHLQFMGISNTTVTNLNTQGSTSSASMFELKFGFQTLHIPSHQFCLDSACPIPNGQQFIVQRSFNLSSIPLYPLADITAKYSAVDADSNHLVCITLAPVGYQHPVWQKIFMYLPIGLTASAAIISLIGSFITFEDSEHDIFLFSSNYAMLPGILRLKTPGFFDLVFYAQFIVIAGQFNIDYPRFHPLFTSNFSWSFLLFRSEWLQDTIKTIFRGQSSPLQEIAYVPGNSLYRRQISNGTDTNKINILGTGMLNFAMATGIDINAMFFTFLVYFLLVFTCCAVCCFLTWLVLFAIAKMNEDEAFTAQCKKVWDFSIGVFIRILSLLYLPMMTVAFYQLMIPSRAYITCFAALFLVFPLLIYGFVCIKLLEIRPASFLFTELKLLLRYGSLYNGYTDDTFALFVGIIVYKSVVAAMIGLFQTSAIAQIILVLLAELAITASYMVKWPCADNQVNIFHIFFGCIKSIILLLNICYLPQLEATSLSKQYVGYCQLGIHCLAFFIFLVLQIKNAVIILTGVTNDELDESGKPPARMVIWRKRHRSKRRPMTTPLQLGNSSANLMSISSRSRSHSASFYMAGQHTNHTRTSIMDMDLLNNYYGTGNNTSSSNNTTSITILKPDEIKRASTPLAMTDTIDKTKIPLISEQYVRSGSSISLAIEQVDSPATIQRYVAQTSIQSFHEEEYAHPTAKAIYRIDDEIVPSTEPLMTSIDHDLNTRLSPPPLPQHTVGINQSSSIYSPPHQTSFTSVDEEFV